MKFYFAPQISAQQQENWKKWALAQSTADPTSHKNLTVIAGGDGTINYVLNQDLQSGSLQKNIYGFIALGSNNSFLKGVAACEIVQNKRTLFSSTNTCAVDLPLLQTDAQIFCFLSNASVGLLAEANAQFMQPASQWLKYFSVSLANSFAFICALLRHKPQQLELEYKISNKSFSLSGRWSQVQVLKSPVFAGELRHSFTSNYSDGKVWLATLRERPRFMLALHFLKWTLSPSAASLFDDLLCVESVSICSSNNDSLHVEFDGELLQSRSLAFTCNKQFLKVCSRQF